MKENPTLSAIAHIEQRDNHHFSIRWTDGKEHLFRLSVLQRRCPCAGCNDDQGQRNNSAPQVDEQVKAKNLRSVGRYALHIEYTSGCSHGIYRYDYLYQIGEEIVL